MLGFGKKKSIKKAQIEYINKEIVRFEVALLKPKSKKHEVKLRKYIAELRVKLNKLQ